MALPLTIKMSAAQHIGQREEQQDSVNASVPTLQEDIGVICVLSDGMGGLKNGKKASQTVVDTMVRTFHQSSVGDTMDQILLRGCHLAQEAVRGLQENLNDCGATVVAAIVRGGRCSFLSVGDSRIYLFRGGSLIQLTRDQNKGAMLEVRIGLGYLPDEARKDKMSHGLTSFLGIETLKEVDRCSHSFEVQPGDRIALLSDGVFDTLSENEIAQAMLLPEEQVANCLVDQVMRRGNPYQDNCSVAIIDCSAPA